MCSHIATTLILKKKKPQHKVTSHFGSALKGKKVFFLRLQMYFLVVLVNNMTLVLTTVSNLVFPSQG